MVRRYFCATVLVIAFISQATFADFGGLAIAGRSGTLGLGGELMLNLLPDVNSRFGVTFFPLSLGGELGDVEYDFDLDALTFPLSMDWYPFQNGFHLTAGAIFNETEVGLGTRSTASLTIGGTTYSAAQLGAVRGDVGFNQVAPYIGIGWGNAFGKEQRWGIVGDLGVAFLGSPRVVLSASGPVASDPAFMQDLAQEESDLEDDLKILRFYPVLSISFFYRF
jgi:hypothetical protein